MIEVNERTFKESVLDEKGLVVVDYNAVWCSPCRMMKPIFDELSGEYNDVKIVGVDVDENPNLASSQGIRNIPTILFFKNGIVVDRMVGAYPRINIKEKIDALRQ